MGQPATVLTVNEIVSMPTPAIPHRESEPTIDADTGNRFVEEGALCAGHAGRTPGCFMADPKRERLIVVLRERISKAGENYKLALASLRVDKLLEKEDDIPWVLSLALDLATAHIASVATSVLMKGKSQLVAALAKRMDDRYLSDASFVSRAERTLSGLTADGLKSVVKSGLKPLQKVGEHGIKDISNETTGDRRQASLSYLGQLSDECDLRFDSLANQVSGFADDATLMLMWESFDISNHQESDYKQSLGAKLARFSGSGAADVGRRVVWNEEGMLGQHYRDIRVVWVQHSSGSRTLWYQSQDGNLSGDDRGDIPWTARGNERLKFGPRQAINVARLTRRVPEEFAAIALARSADLWGEVSTISDPADEYFPLQNAFSQHQPGVASQSGKDGQ